MAAKKIEIYDTTLRDGNQGEGVNLSLHNKLDIARALDHLGVDFLEGGWPGSNPKDDDFFVAFRDMGLNHVRVAAFGSTHRSDSLPEDDFFLAKLVEANADLMCIFGKSWDLHVEQALRVTADRNLEMIEGSIAYLVETTKKPVFYDAEHFFDGFKSDPGYTLASLQVAHDAGAERIILCDTNGGILPSEVQVAIEAVRTLIPDAQLGIHVHNDGGLAVANTLQAVSAGAVQVQGTINGIGERCGNVDLTSVISNLELKLGYQCLPQGHISGLQLISRKVWEVLAMDGPSGQPFVGRSAFAHKGGVHVSAVQRNPETYEHIPPEVVGNSRKILISELSGSSNLKAKLANRYPELEGRQVSQGILEEVQDKEHSGYSYENADGSFDLLVRRHLGRYQPCFETVFYRIYSPSNELVADQTDTELAGTIEASVKVRVKDSEMLCAAEGSGPIDALNQALRKALEVEYPVVLDLHLTDYKVRVVNSTEETAAKVRVFLEHQFAGESFGTIGVNVDIIKASWLALTEAYHYALMQHSDHLDELHTDEAEQSSI
ncbi:MAG: citramalate synthase [Gammaproteobacteria bacterium]|jgi:2-isopropylmalate synthase|nr:citramalate synthase [Gammaproteobacteria bacterium]MBT5202906.1 citramalate synthase [Gammaproteobacteria bacterium]MBT5602400.1 citramalate synthase [Gammaproteobacteria bacterium]MBT6245188.1 citramalate synthase [Gammaproteobacteria bacterium]